MLSVSLQSSSYQMSQWQSSTSEGRQMLGSMSEQSQSYTRVESNDPEFVVGRAESPFDLVQRALARAYEKLASDIELPQTQSGAIGEFEPLTAERVAGNILGFIERRLTLDEAEGATAEQLESRLEAGLKGFKQGFAEAQEQLEALGMLNETVANDIGQTYDLVISGVESLREQFLGTPPNVDTEPRKDDVEELIDSPAKALGMRDAGAVSSSAYDFAQKNTFSFTLVTADGDKVKISASASEAFVARYAESADGREYGAAYESNQRFNLSVQGELDEDELKAINDLLGEVNDLAEDFFAGDVDKAFQAAVDIGYDASEISSFALRLTHTDVQRFSNAYRVDDNESLSNRLKPVGQFAQQALEALKSIEALEQPDAFLRELLNAMSEHKGHENSRLADFVETLKEHLPSE